MIMDISKVNSSSTNGTGFRRDVLDKNAFLRILTTQLSNQDPANAKDNSEYVAQMAQFSSLEQTQNINVTLEKLLTSQKLTEGTGYIGKSVQIDWQEEIITETVTGVKVHNGSVFLVTENGQFLIERVIGVGETSVDK